MDWIRMAHDMIKCEYNNESSVPLKPAASFLTS
jgi:hypothetical protein